MGRNGMVPTCFFGCRKAATGRCVACHRLMVVDPVEKPKPKPNIDLRNSAKLDTALQTATVISSTTLAVLLIVRWFV